MWRSEVDRFIVQASNPRSLTSFDDEDCDIMDAIQTIFPMQAEYAYIVWQHVHIPVNYKYTMSHFLPSIVDAIDRLMQSDAGTLVSESLAQELPAVWYMSWTGDELNVRFEWRTPPGQTLVAHPTLNLSKSAFVNEWKQVLGVVLRALSTAGYTDEHLSDLDRLRRVYESIPQPGVLYREPLPE
jgi:hypothetical protein